MTTKPVTDLALLAEAVDEQPLLFDFSQDEAGAVAEARSWAAHTGTTAIRNHRRVAMVVASFLQTNSVRKTAELLSMSRNTVSAVLRVLEQAGKLEPLKEVFARRLRELALEAVVRTEELVAAEPSIERAATIKANGFILKLAADMDAAAGLGGLGGVHVHGDVTIVQGADPAEEYARMLRSSRVRTVDVESEGLTSKAPPIEPSALMDTAPDTATPRSAIPPDAGPHQVGQQGAGGVAEPPPPSNMDGNS